MLRLLVSPQLQPKLCPEPRTKRVVRVEACLRYALAFSGHASTYLLQKEVGETPREIGGVDDGKS